MSLLYRKLERELLYLQKKMCLSFTAGEDYARNRGSNASSESGLYLAQAKQTMQTDHVIDKDSSACAKHFWVLLFERIKCLGNYLTRLSN